MIAFRNTLLSRDVSLTSSKDTLADTSSRMSTNTQMNGKRPGEEDYSAPDDGSGRVASPGKRQKMTKASRKCDVAEGKEDVLTSILPLRLTTHSGYLPLKDAGRLLLRVSKDMTTSIFEDRVSADALEAASGNGENGAADDDGPNGDETEERLQRLRQRKVRNEVWKTLCELKWRGPKVLEHMASTLGGGGDEVNWEGLFRKFQRTPPKPVARASVVDYSFIFSLVNCTVASEVESTTPLATYVLKGKDAANFLECGECDCRDSGFDYGDTGFLKLDSPVLLENFPQSNGETWWEHRASMRFTIHVLRKSDGKMGELNYGEDMSIADGLGNGFLLCFDQNIWHTGNLEQIMDTEQMGCYLGFQMDPVLRVLEVRREDGSFDHLITHISFSVSLKINQEDSQRFSDFEHMKRGASVADCIERLNIEWK